MSGSPKRQDQTGKALKLVSSLSFSWKLKDPLLPPNFLSFPYFPTLFLSSGSSKVLWLLVLPSHIFSCLIIALLGLFLPLLNSNFDSQEKQEKKCNPILKAVSLLKTSCAFSSIFSFQQSYFPHGSPTAYFTQPYRKESKSICQSSSQCRPV